MADYLRRHATDRGRFEKCIGDNSVVMMAPIMAVVMVAEVNDDQIGASAGIMHQPDRGIGPSAASSAVVIVPFP
jgi:hypothetical protein